MIHSNRPLEIPGMRQVLNPMETFLETFPTSLHMNVQSVNCISPSGLILIIHFPTVEQGLCQFPILRKILQEYE